MKFKSDDVDMGDAMYEIRVRAEWGDEFDIKIACAQRGMIRAFQGLDNFERTEACSRMEFEIGTRKLIEFMYSIGRYTGNLLSQADYSLIRRFVRG